MGVWAFGRYLRMRGAARGDLAAWNSLSAGDLDRSPADFTAAAAAERHKDAMVSRDGVTVTRGLCLIGLGSLTQKPGLKPNFSDVGPTNSMGPMMENRIKPMGQNGSCDFDFYR